MFYVKELYGYLRFMLQHLHIICFDVPFPADYGGVFDVFYKLPALQRAGIQIHLHCFEYGNRSRQKELEKYCVSVQYYKRVKRLGFLLPYIVSSRKNKVLLAHLLKDDYPILMEGVHCTYPLLDKRFANRKMFVRLHNTEFIYYRHLYKNTSHLFKKIYYYTESVLLKKYECRIADKANHFWAMSVTDVALYQQYFGCKTISYLPLFIPFSWQINSKVGSGSYCIYHAKLEVEENEAAAVWLLKNVFAHSSVPFVIAGKNPSPRLIKIVTRHKHATLIGNASQTEMEKLIADAHIHILPSFNATGVKIKLLHSLFNGRHCIVNSAAVKGVPVASLCHIADTAEHMKELIQELLFIPFSSEQIERRKLLLQTEFDNKKNAAVISQSL